MNYKILFIGAGNIAKAIEVTLKNNKDVVIDFWDKEDGKVDNQKPLNDLVIWADVIILCINSWFMREAIGSILPKLKKDTILISVAKGIEDATGLWMDELLEEILSNDQPYGLLSGPMIAKELSEGRGGAAVYASKDGKSYETVKKLFINPIFKVEYSSDPSGVAMSGVLKNIYAMGLGIADGLDLGSNIKGWLTMQSIKEMMSIVQKLGERAETVLGPAGFGDFIATGFSPYSRNHILGQELAQTGKFTEKSEGYSSLPALVKKLNFKTNDFPILHKLRLIVLENAQVKETFESLLK
ncbi:MAG: NAD-dependent glycerol-3-phosphate dehydrogenase domain protein [Parcubacteria group bacterium GW2011_GWA2_38_13]|nr:MAG: NAD-dependent glycerol-3-phosphate dehydrogenase domain protein [Parcubacteria group bacterium GW2011_GWA2_38_13]